MKGIVFGHPVLVLVFVIQAVMKCQATFCSDRFDKLKLEFDDHWTRCSFLADNNSQCCDAEKFSLEDRRDKYSKLCNVVILSIGFTKRVYEVKENEEAHVGVEVTSGQRTTPVTVSVTASPSTAGSLDFVLKTPNITFQPGERLKLVKIDVIDDDIVELTESLTVSLFASSKMHVMLGKPSTVNIKDNDVLIIGFTKGVCSVKENENVFVGVQVACSQYWSTPVTVSVTVSPSTAGSLDFVSKTTNITFQPGERRPKCVKMDVMHDDIVGLGKSLTVSLFSSAKMHVMLGKPSTVNIIGAAALKTCKPKTTFTPVVDLIKYPELDQKFVQVSWCLFPQKPSKMDTFFVGIRSNDFASWIYFEVKNHTRCLCYGDSCDGGYEYIRQKSIRRISKIPPGRYADILQELTCDGGPYIYQEWLGNKELVRPWVQVRRCVTTICSAKVTIVHRMRVTRLTEKITVTYHDHESCFMY